MKTGYELFMGESLGYARDFGIGQPSESVRAGFNVSPAFWSCANKMALFLLKKADRPDGHSIRLHSLIVITIPLTKEAIEGNPNIHRVAIQGNYRDVAHDDMVKSTLDTSRNSNFSRLISPSRISVRIRPPLLSLKTNRSFYHLQSRTRSIFPRPMSIVDLLPTARLRISNEEKIRSLETGRKILRKSRTGGTGVAELPEKTTYKRKKKQER